MSGHVCRFVCGLWKLIVWKEVKAWPFGVSPLKYQNCTALLFSTASVLDIVHQQETTQPGQRFE